MTSTVTVTDNTVKVDDLIFKLDALVSAYDEVLSMAKQQLEQFSISDDDWARIYERLSRSIDYYELGTTLKKSLLNGLQSMGTDLVTSSSASDVVFTQALIGRIRYELEAAVKDHIVKDALKEEIGVIRAELRQELFELANSAAEQKFARICTDQVCTADQERRFIRQLLDSCFGSELRSMARDAMRQTDS
jgi:hypothetical protein